MSDGRSARNIPYLLMSRTEAKERLLAQISKGEYIRGQAVADEEQLREAKRETMRWSEYNMELLRRILSTREFTMKYGAVGIYMHASSLTSEVRVLRAGIDDRLNVLYSVLDRLELIPEASSSDPVTQASDGTSSEYSRDRVFIVHGHDMGALAHIQHCIERLSLKPLVLAEQASKGQTIIEKLEENSDVNFAVVLLTPDDVGFKVGHDKDAKHRPRQNVVFELGFFSAKLGRGRVCALHKGNIELPSDYAGILWISMEDGTWPFRLAQELQAAGLPADMNKLAGFMG